MTDLVIRGVDLELLEKQRLILAGIPRGGIALTQQEKDAIDGIQGMLDVWSDIRARNGCDHTNINRGLVYESCQDCGATRRMAKPGQKDEGWHVCDKCRCGAK